MCCRVLSENTAWKFNSAEKELQNYAWSLILLIGTRNGKRSQEQDEYDSWLARREYLSQL